MRKKTFPDRQRDGQIDGHTITHILSQQDTTTHFEPIYLYAYMWREVVLKES